MSLPTSVIRRHNQVDALSALGLVLEKAVFPAILNCPLCGSNRLHIFEDFYADGPWLHCAECDAHGDIVLFGSQVWSLSLPDTLAKFSELSLASPGEAARVSVDYTRYFTRQQTAENFWFDAKTQIWSHGDDILACRLRDLGLRNETNDFEGLVGVANYEQVAKLCSAAVRPKPPRFRHDGECLVLPFYDFPGRHSGFLLLQYNAAYEMRQHFVPLHPARTRRPEAGYFLLPALFNNNDTRFKATQFIVDDPFWALKTQCGELAINRRLLPIAVSYSGPEAESYGATWRSLGAAVRVFHSAGTTPELISRAANARGYVSNAIIGPRSTTIGRLSAMRAGAHTWQNALRDAIEHVGEMDAQAFLNRLTLPADKLHTFLSRYEDKFSAGFKDRVMAAARTAPQPFVKFQRYGTVIERETGWWTHYGKQISNVRVAITEVIQVDTGEKFYRGYVYDDKDTAYEFHDSAKKIESAGLLAYAATLLAPAGKLVTYERMWNASGHLIAMRLRPPKLVNVSTKYGWDDNTGVFRLSQYEITRTGDVRPTPVWAGQKNDKIFPEPVPVAPLPFHELLTPTPENAFTWAVTAAILGHLVAPMLRKTPQAIGISGACFDNAIAVAKLLGCDVVRPNIFQKKTARRFLNDNTADQSWPLVVCPVFNEEIFTAHAPHFFQRALMLRVYGAAGVAALSYGWQVIKSPPNDHRPGDPQPALAYVLPTYIRRIIKQRAQKMTNSDNLSKFVLDDLHTWLAETYGKTFNIGYSANLLLQPDAAHIALLEELNKAFATGCIDLLPVPRGRKQANNYVVRRADYWWINRRAVDRYFYNRQSIAPNWLGILNLFEHHNICGGEEVIHNMRGILVKTDWCDQFYTPPTRRADKETG